MNQIDIIEFSSNHNGKFFMDLFTTLRRISTKYEVGNTYTVMIGKHEIGTVELISKVKIHGTKLSEGMAYVDYGKSLHEYKALLKKMYGETCLADGFYFLYLKWTKRNTNGMIWLMKNYCSNRDIPLLLNAEQVQLFD